MFYSFINIDVSADSEVCWITETILYGFMMDVCESSKGRDNKDFLKEFKLYVKQVCQKNPFVKIEIVNKIDRNLLFDLYQKIRKSGDPPLLHLSFDKDKLIAEMKKNPKANWNFELIL